MLGALLRKNLGRPLAMIGKMLAKTGVSPNVFTLLSLPIAASAAWFLAQGNLLGGLLLVIAAVAWDSIDGAIARAQGRASPFGNYLDAMIDKYVEIIIYIGVFLLGYRLEAFLVVAGSLVLSYAKPRTAMVVRIDNHDWPAVGERVERVILLVAGLGISVAWPTFDIDGMSFDTLSVFLWIIAVIVGLGGISRIMYAKRLIENGTSL